MGGVDLLDNGVANDRIKVRGKKWWWPLFINLIDCTVVNAWKLYNMVNDSYAPQVDFRSYIVSVVLRGDMETTSLSQEEDGESITETSQPSTSKGRPSKSSLPQEVRSDRRIAHLIIRQEENQRRRCRVCKTNSLYICEKCKVHLHPDCFANFRKSKYAPQVHFRSYIVSVVLRGDMETTSLSQEEDGESITETSQPSTSKGRPSKSSLPQEVRSD
ncbi:hypothetical protein QE152_g30066 [Popillia japonica]|uniref:PiggyBac transposable element-derived protein domain-containing protein n=1 Tax=Popillia japonica TaxID=7064 RepID=A0AAW1JFT1_POPJA